MGALRSTEMEKIYRQEMAKPSFAESCNLCKEPSIQEFEFWKIISNKFPYDKVARVHHMLLPKRCVEEKDLNEEERSELVEIKYGYINENYGHIIEATNKYKSIPGHLHLHLLVLNE